MISLSKEQSEIVKMPIDSAIQVLASAGSGKTRVITERIRHILDNTLKDGVIAITFTNKAADEMKDRLSSIRNLEDRCWITTIHSVAKRIIEQYGNVIGLPSDLHVYEREIDRKTLFLQSLYENGFDVDNYLNISDARQKKRRQKIISSYIERIAVIKRELLTEKDIKERFSKNKDFYQIYDRYQQKLIDSGGIDFDDILLYAHRILLEQQWCAKIYRAKYKHLCIDEAQDLNRAQYEFIKVLSGEKIKSIIMVGDPFQMIYGFNNSSHEYLCTNFINDFSPHQFTLTENYRCSKAVISLANKLNPGSQKENNFALDGKKELLSFDNEDSESDWICKKILDILNEKTNAEIEGDITLDKMVVIARNRFVFQNIENKLVEFNIPFYYKKSDKHEEPFSILAKILDLAIRLRLNPKDWVDGKKLSEILDIDSPKVWGNKNILDYYIGKIKASSPLAQIHKTALIEVNNINLQQPNIIRLVRLLESELTKILEQSEKKDEIERSILEINFFCDCWLDFKRQGLGDTLLAFRNSIALGQVSDRKTPKGLALSTVHTMKGLEKDIVFLMGMCEGVFPDYRAESEKEIEEERNNAFVAVTRARRWIFVTYPNSRKMPWGDSKKQIISRFAKELSI